MKSIEPTEITPKKQRFALKIVVAAFLLIVGTIFFMRHQTGLFRGEAVAIVKVVPGSSSEDETWSERYYKVYESGYKEAVDIGIDKTSARFYLHGCVQSYIDRGENAVLNRITNDCWISEMPITETLKGNNGDGTYAEHYYFDDEGNQYNERPETADRDILALKDGLLKHLAELRHTFKTVLYRDSDTIFVVNTLNVNWWTPNDVYVFDVQRNDLRKIITFDAAEEKVVDVFGP